MADRFKAVSLCRSCEKRATDRQTRRRAARSLTAPVGHGGQRVSPQRFLPLGFVLNASLWRRALGRNGNGRDPTTAQMRCRGRRRRPRPAGPALSAVLSSHRGGTGPAAAFICLLSAGASAKRTDKHRATRVTGLARASSVLWTRVSKLKARAPAQVRALRPALQNSLTFSSGDISTVFSPCL